MERPGRLRLLATVLVVLVAGGAGRAGAAGDVRRVTLVAFSDWHGQLEPLTLAVAGTPRPLGGAAVLKVYVDRERARNPGGTLVVTAGDAFGATPPLSSFLEDVPAVEALNALGLDADTFGNHNFDHGLPRLRRLMGRARFPYLAANVVAPDGRTLAPPSRVFTLNGVRVGVVGIANPETPRLVAAGHHGDFRFLEPVAVINAQAGALRRRGVDLVVVIAHIGATAVDPDGAPRGSLGRVARAVRGVDVLIGDHTDVSVQALVGGTLVVESRSRGIQYAVVDLDYDRARRVVARRRAALRWAFADEVAPDPGLQALIEGYRTQVQPLLDRTVAEAAQVVGRSRAGESPLGDLVADALRAAYGTQLAFTVSGGLRDDLPSSYRPADRRLRRPAPGYRPGPPYDLVQGDFLAVFPFANVAVTFRITGRTLWAALEHSVAAGEVVDGRFTGESGRFLQVSGFRFRFDPTRPPGRRVVAVRLADGTPVAPDDTEYTATTIDFVYEGGDGYGMLRNGTGTTREPLAEIVARAAGARSPIRAAVEGRIAERR